MAAWNLVIKSLLVSIFLSIFSAGNVHAAGAPTIAVQPASANPALGASISIFVTASSPDGGTLSYQWLYRANTSSTAAPISDTTTLTGTTTNILSLSSVTASQSGLYSVRVTNTVGGSSSTVTTSEAVVFVALASETFENGTLNSPSNWIMTYLGSYSTIGYSECLTANNSNNSTSPAGTTGSVSTSSIPGCLSSGSGDSNTVGQGALRITTPINNQASFVLYNPSTPLATSNGVDISFYESMWGSSTLSHENSNYFAADGMTFFLKDGTDADSTPGAAGGALGYSTNNGNAGLSNSLFGVALDVYGNYTGSGFGGSDCNDPTNQANHSYQSTISRVVNGVTVYDTQTETYADSITAGHDGTTPYTGSNGPVYNDLIAIRGPQGTSKTQGYCVISPSIYNATLGHVSGSSTTSETRSTFRHLVRILIDGNTVATPKIKLYLDGALAITTNAPKQYLRSPTFKFGFTGSTGGANQKIEIWATQVNTYTGITPPDSPISPTISQGSSNSQQVVSWTAPGSWGIGEAASGTRSYTATVYDAATGNTAQGFSCTATGSVASAPPTTCTISGITSGTYVVKVTATNASGLTSAPSTATSSFTSTLSAISTCSNFQTLQNGSFENGIPSNTTWASYDSGHTIDQIGNILQSSPNFSWHTTESDNYIELQRLVDTVSVSSNSATSHPPFTNAKNKIAVGLNYDSSTATPYDGSYIAEINATIAGMLYQDVTTTPGTVMLWSLAHKGRKDPSASESMTVEIGNPLTGQLKYFSQGLNDARDTVGYAPTNFGVSLLSSSAYGFSDFTHVLYPSDTVTRVPQTIYQNGTGSSVSVTYPYTYSNNQNVWGLYSGSYVVPIGDTTTRFGFTSLVSGSVGNLLDNIVFTPLAACPDSVIASGNNTSANNTTIAYNVLSNDLGLNSPGTSLKVVSANVKSGCPSGTTCSVSINSDSQTLTVSGSGGITSLSAPLVISYTFQNGSNANQQSATTFTITSASYITGSFIRVDSLTAQTGYINPVAIAGFTYDESGTAISSETVSVSATHGTVYDTYTTGLTPAPPSTAAAATVSFTFAGAPPNVSTALTYIYYKPDGSAHFYDSVTVTVTYDSLVASTTYIPVLYQPLGRLPSVIPVDPRSTTATLNRVNPISYNDEMVCIVSTTSAFSADAGSVLSVDIGTLGSTDAYYAGAAISGDRSNSAVTTGNSTTVASVLQSLSFYLTSAKTNWGLAPRYFTISIVPTQLACNDTLAYRRNVTIRPYNLTQIKSRSFAVTP